MHKRSIAIVYDWMDKWGGVERILTELKSLFPQADFYTSAVNFKTAPWAEEFSPTTTFLQSFPPFVRGERKFLIPLYPAAFESMRFDEYQTVISITSSFAKSIITHPDTFHLCYLLTPTRFLWSHTKEYLDGWHGMLGRPLITHMREWDIIASSRPDRIVSISNTVRDRCRAYYDQETKVIYPPFDTAYWDKTKISAKPPKRFRSQGKYYLYVSRMEKYKMPHLVVEVAKLMPQTRFIFVGTGSMTSYLKKLSPQNCQFLDFIPDTELSYLYSNAEALIFPQVEDFGYVALEAQYHGCPVVAFEQGGACETVQNNKSGLFFSEQTSQSLMAQLERYSKISYNLKRSTLLIKGDIKKRFGLDRFRSEFFYQLHNANI